ncbi:hypothetical protein TNCV_3851031 [Trichonephila clavipes]|nr:hypothetical protein TNCV_3851031 [Trichonephila clavipes]
MVEVKRGWRPLTTHRVFTFKTGVKSKKTRNVTFMVLIAKNNGLRKNPYLRCDEFRKPWSDVTVDQSSTPPNILHTRAYVENDWHWKANRKSSFRQLRD